MAEFDGNNPSGQSTVTVSGSGSGKEPEPEEPLPPTKAVKKIQTQLNNTTQRMEQLLYLRRIHDTCPSCPGCQQLSFSLYDI